jgi:hypothetical protein
LYKGKKISYQAPFEKGNRVADYKLAWKWFVEVFMYKVLGFILSQIYVIIVTDIGVFLSQIIAKCATKMSKNINFYD